MENALSLSKRKILLADDSITIQKVVNLTFADEDVEVVTVADGDSAIRIFNEVAPDLVLADVNMPGLDGYQLCEKIKQDARTKQIPVILLVGSFEPFDEEKAQHVGADDYLTKPFQSILQLVNKVSDLLDARTDEEEFLAPLENEPAPVNSFADTLKMMPTDEFDSADASIDNLGDTGMDDEMIQTAQVGNARADEIEEEFESSPVYQSFAEDLDQNSPTNSVDYPPHEDWAKTHPVSKEELEKLDVASGGEKNASVLSFDELDLLDLLPVKQEAAVSETVLSFDSENTDEQLYKTRELNVENLNETPEISEETSDADAENFSNIASPETLSSELIEAIAGKVVEKLSDEVIRKIVREVIAQMENRN